MQPDDLDISNDDVLLAVEKKLSHRNFRILSQIFKPDEEQIGLLRKHVFSNITVLNNINNQENTLTFFVKLFPKQDVPAYDFGAFQKEEFAYELFEHYSKCNIDLISKCTATYYITRPNKYMILDNLSAQGYLTPDKTAYLDYHSILVVLHYLAELHASSIIFEEKMSKKLGKKFKILDGNEDTLYCDSEDFTNKDTIDTIMKCFETEMNMFQFEEILNSGKDFREVTKEMFPRIFELVKPSKTYRNVLCHGNLWTSNIVFKSDNNGKASSCKFVNFQNVRYVPPSHDVLLLIYMTTSKEFRKNHLYELIGIYYNYLEKILKVSEYNITTIIPFFEFLESCEEQKLFAVFWTAIVIPVVLSRRDTLETYFSNKELLHKGVKSILITDNENNEKFMARARESLEDLIEECEKFK